MWRACHRLTQVALGRDHTLALDADERTVYAWGKSSEGQLGTGGKAFMRPPSISPALSAPVGGAVTVQELHALGDCSAAIHKPPCSSEPAAVFVGRSCRELESAFRSAFVAANLN